MHLRPHRSIIEEGALAPLHHRFRIKIVAAGDLLDRSLRSLYSSSDGVRGLGTAVKNLSHRASRNVASTWLIPRHSGTAQRIKQRVGVVRLVANQSLWISLLKQRLCASQIVRLPRREHHIDGIAEGIDKGVNFSGQSAAGSADRLLAVFFRAPALCWCARTMVASMIMYSLSCSLASSLKIRSKTPLFAHRLKR